MPTRKKIAPGSQVIYVGPHVDGYLPALNVGLVEHVGIARSRVKYPWGCHSILTDRLAAVAPAVQPLRVDRLALALVAIVGATLLDLL